MNLDRYSILGIPLAVVVADPNRIAGAACNAEEAHPGDICFVADTLEDMAVAPFAEQVVVAAAEVDRNIGYVNSRSGVAHDQSR